MYKDQNGCCAICGKHQSVFRKKLNVDHDHKTDKVRGLLCLGCNYGLGVFKADEGVELLLKAAEYIENNP